MSSLLEIVRPDERAIERRPFEAWSISIPAWFSETFIREGEYWHAWTRDRSVSLTSIVIADHRGRPVAADEISRQIGPKGMLPDGKPLKELPPGCVGRCVIADAIQPAVASTTLCGFLVAEARLLIVTITADDLEWARETWLSIRRHPTRSTRAQRRCRSRR